MRAGPPSVSSQTSEKIRIAKMYRNINATKTAGRIRRKVTCQKVCHAVAPSTLADSISSFGIVVTAA